MSDRQVGDLSCHRWIEDLEDVIEAAGVGEPALLFGVSQGAAVAVDYAARYPERVAGLVLYGGYAVGARGRDDVEFARACTAMQELLRTGWGKDNPIFRQLFTSRFIPEGTDEQIGWFNDLCRRTTTPENAYRLLDARADVDVRHQLSKVRAPTLVLHADGDEVIPVGEGKRLARDIPGAEHLGRDAGTVDPAHPSRAPPGPWFIPTANCCARPFWRCCKTAGTRCKVRAR